MKKIVLCVLCVLTLCALCLSSASAAQRDDSGQLYATGAATLTVRLYDPTTHLPITGMAAGGVQMKIVLLDPPQTMVANWTALNASPFSGWTELSDNPGRYVFTVTLAGNSPGACRWAIRDASTQAVYASGDDLTVVASSQADAVAAVATNAATAATQSTTAASQATTAATQSTAAASSAATAAAQATTAAIMTRFQRAKRVIDRVACKEYWYDAGSSTPFAVFNLFAADGVTPDGDHPYYAVPVTVP